MKQDLSSMKHCGIFVLAVGMPGCASYDDTNVGFPPVAESEPSLKLNSNNSAKPSPDTPAKPGSETTATPKPGSKANVEPGPVDADAAEKFTTTDTGLKYRIRRKSDGNKPTATSRVVVRYKGWLDNGKTFDSSYARGKSSSFSLNEVVKGWTEGMQLIGEGGMIELEVPQELAYGAQGQRGIPPNRHCIFLLS